MSQWNKITSAVTVLLLATAAHPLFSQSTPLDPTVSAALDEGKKFEQRHQLTSALDSYRKALKLTKGKCADCLQAISNLQARDGAAKRRRLLRRCMGRASRSSSRQGQRRVPPGLRASPPKPSKTQTE
ncbi:hypothetical protein RBB78_02465 [Tunturiibacter empetritectus]|uniref:hypothetical protein n=1 Tax=Tunturiibacter empetritectus TaxID=3069691 RepID=UPI003D9B9873